MNPLQSTIVRVVMYALSTVISALPVAFLGFVAVNPDAGTLTIDIEAAVAAVVGGLGLSGAIFAKFGKK
jgi:hypothetical protein